MGQIKAGLDTKRLRWFNQSREDLADRYFFRSLFRTNTLAVTANNAGPYTLFDDLTRPQALKILQNSAATVTFTNPYDPSGITITLSRDFSTGKYQVTFSSAFSANDTLNAWYYAALPLLTTGADLVLVDGQATLLSALRKYFFSIGEWDHQDEARDELENRIEELLRLDAISLPGELTSMQSFERAKGYKNEKSFYGGNTRRRL